MRRKFKDGLFVVVVTVLFSVGLKSCVIDAYKIPSGSMNPALIDGDFLLVNKFVYGARTPQKFFYIPLPHVQFPRLFDVQRGHVVVFDFPGEPNEVLPIRNLFLIKRCIGLPGDTVEISGGNVIVNGTRMAYFAHAEKDFPRTVVPRKGMPLTLSPAAFTHWKVFIQREGSTVDVRDGVILIDQQETQSYSVKKDYYFVLGDNINNSSDSRSWGFVPEDNIVGKAMMVYWSKDADGIRWNRIGTVVR